MVKGPAVVSGAVDTSAPPQTLRLNPFVWNTRGKVVSFPADGKLTTLLLSIAAAAPTVDGVDPLQVTPPCRDTNQAGGSRRPPLPV